MSRRRRESKRRHPAGPHGDLFQDSDGVTPLFDGDIPYAYPNRVLARAAWEECRVDTWARPSRGIWPPCGAVVYDGITEHARFPAGETRPAAIGAAVEADVASVVAFRENEPAKAATIAEALDRYLADLDMVRNLAEQLGADESCTDVGYVLALRRAMSDYEMHRCS